MLGILLNPRIALGALIIVGAAAALTVGGTGAFFSDTETSTGNTFAAGALDLKVDNDSYYNGNRCVNIEPDENDPDVWQWVGPNPYPAPGTPCTTSWELDDLSNGHLFFNFLDLKPDDDGEDTISLHVQNDAWACMNITLTSNDDNSSTEPELGDGDVADVVEDVWDGELAQHINMLWWADDGDNVYEVDENQISVGVQSLFAMATTSPFRATLADPTFNAWNVGNAPGPMLAANNTYYIGKAWCLGTLVPTPLTQDGPNGDGPQVRGGGYTCDGTLLNNLTQTDGASLDIQFVAEQARNNPGFRCETCTADPELDLITGGDGFESPVVATPQLWNIYPSPVNGWNVEWRDAGTTSFGNQTRPELAQLEYHRGVLGSAYQGQQYVELDTDWGGPTSAGTGEPASARMYKDITTVPGANYTINFAFAPRPNTAASQNRLEVRFGGNVVHDTGNVAGGGGPIAWSPFVVNVQATTTTTRIAFTDMGVSDSLGTFVDDIRFYQLNCGGVPIN